jgi:hypothetical protein
MRSNKMEVYKGIIQGFSGTWNSGLAMLFVEKEDGEFERLLCDNAPTVRAIDAAFPGFIRGNHSVDNNAIKGKEIFYSCDDMGMLESFTPVEEASEEFINMYETTKEKKE